MKIMRKIVEIDQDLCNGCGQCLPNCAEGAMEIVDGKARLKADKLCDGLGACLGHCPMGALKVVERQAEDFDEAAVQAQTAHKPMPCGCPGSNILTFAQPAAGAGQSSDPQDSCLGHWPVKLRLVPPAAPFLRGAEVIIAADCAPVALADFNSRLRGQAVMIACPKFDDARPYLEKLVEMFRHAGIKKVTVLRMEVPCCSGLSSLVRQAAAVAGTGVPVEDLIVTRTGQTRPAEAEGLAEITA
jgi:NAD-dependent dihydropyrimidine dehydrogenase PreA subunit